MDFLLQTASSMLAEPAMQVVIAIVFVTGIVRGFSGFGTGMIIGPSTAALYSPITSLAIISIVDSFPALPLVWSARHNVNWKEVLPIVIGYALLIPLGVWVLKTGDPIVLRWFISISILFAVVILWSGWQYKGPRTAPISFAIGGVGGFMGAAAALPGPPVLVYWLAGAARAITVRANMIYYLFLTDLMVIVGYLVGDIYTADNILRAILCIPGYLVGMFLGSRFFSGASDKLYRTIAFTMILISAVTSLPFLDSILR
ncbi:MAG: sulfite exporter TauE/SafE family protein [Pseudomonadota bacterium]